MQPEVLTRLNMIEYDPDWKRSAPIQKAWSNWNISKFHLKKGIMFQEEILDGNHGRVGLFGGFFAPCDIYSGSIFMTFHPSCCKSSFIYFYVRCHNLFSPLLQYGVISRISTHDPLSLPTPVNPDHLRCFLSAREIEKQWKCHCQSKFHPFWPENLEQFGTWPGWELTSDQSVAGVGWVCVWIATTGEGNTCCIYAIFRNSWVAKGTSDQFGLMPRQLCLSSQVRHVLSPSKWLHNSCLSVSS